MASITCDDVGGVGDAQDHDLARPGDTGGIATVHRAQHRPPLSIGPRRRDATVTVWPASSRWRVIGSPIAPSPMNPTFTGRASSEAGDVVGHALEHDADRLADLDGGGVDLVDRSVGDGDEVADQADRRRPRRARRRRRCRAPAA